MWFDARKAMAELVGGDMPPATVTLATLATVATVATRPRLALPRGAVVASVAGPQSQNPNADLKADAAQLADRLLRFGPLSYGAAAVVLGWGATRAWRAEAELLNSDLLRYDALGRAAYIPQGDDLAGMPGSC